MVLNFNVSPMEMPNGALPHTNWCTAIQAATDQVDSFNPTLNNRVIKLKS